MEDYKDSLKFLISKVKYDNISAGFANFLNHQYGNVLEEGKILQYTFCDGDSLSDVKKFFEKYYPDLCDELFAS